MAGTNPTRRALLAAAAATVARPALAQGGKTVRIGLILPLTGPFASTGRQVEAAVRTYLP